MLAPGGEGERCAEEADWFRWFGLWAGPGGFLLAALAPLALTMWLFLGPLVMSWLRLQREHTWTTATTFRPFEWVDGALTCIG